MWISLEDRSLATSQNSLPQVDYAPPVKPDQFVYPPGEIPLLEAYDGRFEAVFIVLHPFISVPEHLAWSVTRQYPTDQEIIASGSRYTWAEAGRQSGLASCARMNQALLTATGSLTAELADPVGQSSLQSFLQSQAVWMPTEGRFEPLLQNHLLQAFASAGWNELVYVPEVPTSDPVEPMALSELRNRSIPFPGCGTLLAPDASFLLTVDWDSFFTLFYGPRDFIARTSRELKFEGFFATPATDHAWFNYSMGCATVTLSPEHWQTAESKT